MQSAQAQNKLIYGFGFIMLKKKIKIPKKAKKQPVRKGVIEDSK